MKIVTFKRRIWLYPAMGRANLASAIIGALSLLAILIALPLAELIGLVMPIPLETRLYIVIVCVPLCLTATGVALSLKWADNVARKHQGLKTEYTTEI